MSEKTSGFQSSHPPPTLSFAETSYAAALRLLSLVDAEFEALKKQDLTGFEALQPEKLQLLEQLGEVAKKIEQGKLEIKASPNGWTSRRLCCVAEMATAAMRP